MAVPVRAGIINPFGVLPWQRPAWRDKSPIQLCTGSAGGGKSRLCAEKIHAYLLKYPNSTGLMVRKTRESVRNSIVTLMERRVIGEDARINHARGDRRFEYSNGSILIYGGMRNEDQRQQVRSIGLEGGVDIVWMEEATQFVEEDFNEILARMRGRSADWQQILLSTNPDSPYHWIYKRLILGGEASVHLSSAEDNYYNAPSYLRLLKTLTGIQRLRLVEGLWRQAEGTVHEAFDEKIHVINRLPDGWQDFPERFGAVDWGFRNPGVIQVWLADGDGRLYLVEEVYQTGKLIGWWTERANALAEKWNIQTFVCDPAEPAYIEQFQMAGLSAEGANNEIIAGIDKVNDRLKIVPEEEGGDGKPRIYFLRDACSEPDMTLERKYKPTSTLQEIPGYVWLPPGANTGLIKEKPVDLNDHGLNCTRYMCMFYDSPRGVLLA